MQQIRCLLSNFYLNMFRASLCPSSGEQVRVLLHMVFCTGCAGCGCVQLGRKLCALCEGYCSNTTHTHTHTHTHTTHTHTHRHTHNTHITHPHIHTHTTHTHTHTHHTPHIGFVASCWFISLHPTFHDARRQEPKTFRFWWELGRLLS